MTCLPGRLPQILDSIPKHSLTLTPTMHVSDPQLGQMSTAQAQATLVRVVRDLPSAELPDSLDSVPRDPFHCPPFQPHH